MRRMRDLTWQYGLYAIPAVAAAFGLQYLIRTHHPGRSGSEMAAALKPSYFKPDSAAGTEYEGARAKAARERSGAKREVAAVHEANNRVRTQEDLHPGKAEAETEDAGESAVADADTDVPEQETAAPAKAVHHEEKKPAVTTQTMSASNRTTASAEKDKADLINNGIKENVSIGAITGGSHCSAIEYRGDGPQYTKITKAEWATVMKQFHDVKADLVAWLERHRRGFPDKTFELMQQQVESLKIQRPPAMEEPDLTWRGIGVWTQSGSDEPLVRMGSGFVKLAIKQPARAKFEMARLVAQSWAPCELKRVAAGEAWEPLLSCLGVAEDNACAVGTFSEGGWAVSTAIAAIVAPPGCTLPAFADVKVAQCLKKVPLPLKVAEADIEMGIGSRSVTAQR